MYDILHHVNAYVFHAHVIHFFLHDDENNQKNNHLIEELIIIYQGVYLFVATIIQKMEMNQMMFGPSPKRRKMNKDNSFMSIPLYFTSMSE